MLADQRTCYGRGNGNSVFLDIGFEIANHLVSRFIAGFFVRDRHGSAKNDFVARIQLTDIDHLCRGQCRLELLDSSLDKPLLFPGRMILGVLL